MPDPTADQTRPDLSEEPALPQYRISGYYSDDVHPPRLAGELADQHPADDEAASDQIVMELAARTDLQRIVVERRNADDFNITTTNSSWTVWRTWTRNDDGHGWSHS